jgi:PAS domain S-box-containing protein
MKNYPIRIALIYLIAGSLWIFLSDWAVEKTYFPSTDTTIHTIKGFSFILISAIGLYLLVKFYYTKIRQKEEEYQRLFQDNPHPMFVYDLQTLSILTANNVSLEKYGYSREEFLKLKITDLSVDPSYLADFVKRIQNASYLDSGVWENKKKDGSVFFARTASHSTTFNGKKARVVLSMDTHEQVKAQRELQLSENKLKGLINNSDDLIWLIDKGGAIITANEAFIFKLRKLLGITIDVCERTDIRSFPANDFTRNWTAYFLRAIRGEHLKVEEAVVNGNNEFYEIILNPIHDESNEIIGVGCFARDITHLKNSENRIKQQVEKLKEISWIQSHELRKPVANIIGIVDLLKGENNEQQEQQLLQHLDESAKELDSIIKRIVEKSSGIN